MPTPSSELTLIERVERASDIVAHCIELDGDVYLGLYERLETELNELKRREPVKGRARRRLQVHQSDGNLRAT